MNKLKRVISIVLLLIMTVTAMAGCASSQATTIDLAQTDSNSIVLESDELLDEEDDKEETAESVEAELTALAEKAIGKSYPDELEVPNETINLDQYDGLVEITEKGSYLLMGTFDGQILVDVEEEDVQLILAGVTLTNSEDAPIYIKSADEATITLMQGTTNNITNTSVYMEESVTDIERTNGAIYSKADLAINGSGSLIVEGNDKTAILSKDDLVILSGDIQVTSDRHGIKGKDLLYIANGNYEIESGKDGLNSEVLVYIADGLININNSYEGIEAYDIIINGGIINILASDDGINIADPDAVNEPRGQKIQIIDEETESVHGLRINNGIITVSSQGDGLDANASIWMTGGHVVVNGTSNDRDSAIDFDDSFTMSGGELLAVGSIGMAQVPSDTSTQNTIGIVFDNIYEAGTEIKIKSETDAVIATYKSEKIFQCLVVSSASLNDGESYAIYVDEQLIEEITINQTITTVGTFPDNHGGGPRAGGPKGMGPKPDLGILGPKGESENEASN